MCEVTHMAKMTKTQKLRALRAMRNKAFDLTKYDCMSVNDYSAISRICIKYENKLK